MIKKMLIPFMAVYVTISLFTTIPVCFAIDPPRINPKVDIPPADRKPGPLSQYRKENACAQLAVLKDSQDKIIPSQEAFHVKDLHKFAKGKGQKIAIIGTGVQPNHRLRHLSGGGDYITGGDGLDDCDMYSSIIASIIEASPSHKDGIVGVAPEADIISIRQTSAAYQEVPNDDKKRNTDQTELVTLSEAIVHAADLGATVIVFSVISCVDVTKVINARMLAGALWYAATVKNVVLVAAAGNKQGGSCGGNPFYDPDNPSDERNWAGVKSISFPSVYTQEVLSVGATTLQGGVWSGDAPGPWVGVSTVGVGVVSVDPKGSTQMVNARFNPKDHSTPPLEGTQYSAAFVAGLAALIRERYPLLTSHQVINRLMNSAHTPSVAEKNLLGGGGVVDSIEALTGDVLVGAPYPSGISPIQVDPIVRHVAVSYPGMPVVLLSIFGGGVFLVFVAILVRLMLSSRRRG